MYYENYANEPVSIRSANQYLTSLRENSPREFFSFRKKKGRVFHTTLLSVDVQQGLTNT
jgi:hypothetical protein